MINAISTPLFYWVQRAAFSWGLSMRQLYYAVFFGVLFICKPSFATSANSLGGIIDFNVYPYMSDVESDNVVTINVASKLPNRFSYFSLSNFGNQALESELEETLSFYTEQNVRWQIREDQPFDLTLQVNLRSGENNDRHRLGIRWRINQSKALAEWFERIHLSWSMNFHLVQFDNEAPNVWQIEHVYKLAFPWLTERLYLAGFIDHTFNQDLPSGMPSNPIVGETQIGYRLFDHFYFVTEYRVNQYRRDDVNNLAMGLEYIIKW